MIFGLVPATLLLIVGLLQSLPFFAMPEPDGVVDALLELLAAVVGWIGFLLAVRRRSSFWAAVSVAIGVAYAALQASRPTANVWLWFYCCVAPIIVGAVHLAFHVRAATLRSTAAAE